ncbi:MAG: tRNA (adenosine(37)-N6)-threonylcarbamoyltransferase complex dimerization subunit type 1 TsaB [Acidimicrobiia bacterium]
MHLLCFDTATPRVSVAVGSDGAAIAEIDLPPGRRHAEELVPAIAEVCERAGIALDAIAAVCVGTGPGLFTGLRVGVTTAKVLAQALRVPVVGVPTLDLVAYPLRHATRLVVPTIDARRGEVFYALYRGVPGGLQRISDYEIGSPQDLAGELAARGDEVLIAGDGALQYRVEFDELEHVELAGPTAAWPRAAALLELATSRVEREEFCAPWELEPLYLRASDAEIEWDRRGL